MSKDTIYREDAIGACAYETLECYEARKTIRALPSADRPQGEWIHEIDDMGIYRQHTVRCSNCKCGFTNAYVVLLCGDTGDLFRYCPNCGARMKGADDEV